MQFVTDQATVVSQDSAKCETPRIGSYRAVVTLIPREDCLSWVGARTVKKSEKEIPLNVRVVEYAESEKVKDMEQMKNNKKEHNIVRTHSHTFPPQ